MITVTKAYRSGFHVDLDIGGRDDDNVNYFSMRDLRFENSGGSQEECIAALQVNLTRARAAVDAALADIENAKITLVEEKPVSWAELADHLEKENARTGFLPKSA